MAALGGRVIFRLPVPAAQHGYFCDLYIFPGDLFDRGKPVPLEHACQGGLHWLRKLPLLIHGRAGSADLLEICIKHILFYFGRTNQPLHLIPTHLPLREELRELKVLSELRFGAHARLDVLLRDVRAAVTDCLKKSFGEGFF